jgi:phosphatidylglycerol:prolipoprotein diacylglycerol transferase
MHPTLVQLGPFPLHSYGLMLAVSFFLGILLASRRAPSRGLHPDLLFDASLVIVFASILGARLMYVLFHRQEMHSLLDVVALWSGGLTMYGGVLAAMGAVWVFVRRRHVPFLSMADVVAPSLALGLGLTRIGCFLNGCCYGRPTQGPFGVVFPPESFVGRVFENTPLHPTQLYSAVTGLSIVVVLLLFDRRPRRAGQVFGLWLMLDATGRFGLDFLRYYEANAYVLGGLTVNQVICAGLFGLGVLVLVRSASQPLVTRSLPATRTEVPVPAPTAGESS